MCSIPLTNLCSFAPGPNTRIEDKSVVELDEYVLEPAEDEEEDQFSGARYQYYKSEKILGQLYRAIDVSKIWKEDIRSKIRPAGASFWDEFILKIRPRYEAVVGHVQTWTVHLETAREIRGWYEAAISDAMKHYSEHPIKPITELEVFVGNILNRSGVQTNRQRDSSTKLRDEFERISNCTCFSTSATFSLIAALSAKQSNFADACFLGITKSMRRVSHDPGDPVIGYQDRYDNLHLCFACVHAGGKAAQDDLWRQSHDYDNLQSFRVVAACALLSELNTFEVGRGGGGYVGVRGNGAAPVRTGTGVYAAVPPPSTGL